ncbi:hypothetical protein SBRCBS47491_007235 [Sporothrix bragantina]|uniref:EKC/KEOPS complex subunit BUD32 n=1 Tax=Sporothrix bragantina TaxID=671064 RepID=A0ABP0CBW7_9PEZI
MSLVEHLLRISSGICRVWRTAFSRCSQWWGRLLAFVGLRQLPGAANNKAAATPAKEGADIDDDGKPGTTSTTPAAENNGQKPQRRPAVINYVDIAGEWERALHPNWPETAFQIPKEVPYGTIYHVRKGKFVGFGSTARIELAPQGYVIKTPKSNPYDLREEQRNFADMRHEAEVYLRVGPDCPYIPKLVAWDSDTCCLSLEHLSEGELNHYIKGLKAPDWKPNPPHIEPSLRRRWALQVTRGLCALHAAGIVHADLTPRNVLLGADMNVRVADFAGSSFVGDKKPYKVCAGERYLLPGWTFDRTPVPADDVFLLAGVLYFILTSQEPHHHVESEFDVAKLYEEGTFPDTEGVQGDQILQGCWTGRLTTAEAVLGELLAAFGTDDDPLANREA